MSKSAKISLHIIESYYNLESELNMLSSLSESELFDYDEEYHQLFEHRGKPDPAKVREREESRKRGAERHKNALERKRKEELLQKANKIKKQGQAESEFEKKQQKQQQVPDDKQQQQKQQVTDAKKQQKQQQQVPDTKQQQEAEKINLKAKQSKAQLDHTIKHMSSTAPTKDAKQHSKDMSKDIDDMNRQMVSAYSKLTPAERKRRKQREREEMSEKYDQIEEKYLNKMETPEERVWFKKNFAKIKHIGIGTADNIFDLMGYKAVYTDIADATKFILGKK